MTSLKNKKQVIVDRYKEPDNKFWGKLSDILLMVSGSLEASNFEYNWIAWSISITAKIISYFTKQK